ncbi:MAG: SoxR reducing system RseC family protein [Prevotellaceae bacterium]|jgi:sigma-E factor negative regulatory protein RseC|nr:SoxR reducing system RseC family protein [Prevotellaceae bacterium]
MQLSNRKEKTPCIEHAGQVVNITSAEIKVSIISLSACTACHAKGFCSTFDQKEKNITVPNIGQKIHVGDKVKVNLKQSLGIQAVALAYLVPVILVIIAILAFTSFGVSEPVSGLLSLAIAGVYYIILYLFRHKLKKVYNFHIIKTE